MIRLFFRQMALWAVLLFALVAMGVSVLGVGLVGLTTSNPIWALASFVVLVMWVSLFGVLFDGPPMRFINEWVDGRRERFFDAEAWARVR